MLHRRDGARFPPDVTLGIQAKEFNLGFIRPENHVSFTEEWLANLPLRSDWWSAVEMEEPSRRTTISTEEL
jgi:hypothetical protein